MPVLAKEQDGDRPEYGPTSATTGRSAAAIEGTGPPAAIFFYSRDRDGEHPRRHLAGYAGILQADAYAGFNDLYEPARKPGPITEAACWSHGRRKFFVLADYAKAPLALEAVRRIDAIFAIEREINGLLGGRAPGAAPDASSPAGRAIWKRGCAPSAPGSRATTTSPRRWITC